MRIMIGGVADGADDGEGCAELQAYLRHGCAFHLDTQYVGQKTEDLLPFFLAADELVATGDVAIIQFRSQAEVLHGLLADDVFHAFIN